MGGGGGQEDVFGPGYFFRLRRDPVFLFTNNTKRIVEIFLSWISFSGKLGPGFFFRKIFLPHPLIKSNGRSLTKILSQTLKLEIKMYFKLHDF